MPVTGVVFKEGEKMIITAGLDYRYCIVKQYLYSPIFIVRDIILYIGIVLAFLIFIWECLGIKVLFG